MSGEGDVINAIRGQKRDVQHSALHPGVVSLLQGWGVNEGKFTQSNSSFILECSLFNSRQDFA